MKSNSTLLNLSPELADLPVEFLSLRTVIFGGSGAGKTATGRVIVEESTKAGIPCGVIDLKADWWGLRSSADGKHDGLPVVIFGGEHQDVPIHENGGAELAEIVAELRQSFIIDLEEFSKGKQLRFLAAFFDRFYDKNRSPMKLICDESDRYIPQRILTKDPNASICLGAGEDIAKRGRKHGIFPMFISQRNADLNKSVTELCDVAIVFRTSGPNDQKAVNDWFECKGSLVTEEQRLTVMDKISGLQNGEAIICSAHPHLKIFRQVQMRMPETFDSSATPEIGKELIQPKKLAPIELAALSDRMRATIEQAKANDPQVLQAKVREQNAQIAKLYRELLEFHNRATNAKPVEKIKPVPMLTAGERARLTKLTQAFDRLYILAESGYDKALKLGEATNELKPEIEALKRILTPEPAPEPARIEHYPVKLPKDFGTMKPIAPPVENGYVRPKVLTTQVDGSISPKGQKILNSIAEMELLQAPRPERQIIGLLSGYTNLLSKGFTNAISELRTAGLVNYPDSQTIELTAAGREQAQYPEAPRSSAEIQQRVCQLLGGKSESILRAVIGAYPSPVPRLEVAAAAGYGNLLSKGFANATSRLRTLGFIDYPDSSTMVAKDILFLK